MKKYFLQLGIALTLSISVLLSTIYWYRSVNQSSRIGKNVDVVADVNQVTNEVERKPVNSLIWKSIDSSDLIYDGEAIRTLPLSQVKIYFRESNSYLDLEPDSLIVVRKSKGEISLDLMEGNILVAKGTDESSTENLNNSKSSLVLNSNKGKIDLSQATATLSKSKGEELNLQVIKGNASILDQTGKEKRIHEGSSGVVSDEDGFKEKNITLLAPDLNKTLFTLPDKKMTIPFQWKGFSEDAQVELWLGSSAKNLKFYKKTRNVKSEGSLAIELPSGIHFWKLMAKDKLTQKSIGQSPLNKIKIEMKYPPVVLGPPNGKRLVVDRFPTKAIFRTQGVSNYQKINVEFSAHSDFVEPTEKHPLTRESDLAISLQIKGKYYWRYTTYFEEIPEPLMSATFSFEALTKADDITPIQLTWDQTQTLNEQYYVNEPQLKLKWKTQSPDEVKNVKFWRVQYSEIDSENKDPIVAEVSPIELSIQPKTKKPGRYLASIQGVDSENRVLGATEPKEISLQELPLLPTPTFLAPEKIIKTKANGEITLQWAMVPGAKEYWIQILKNGTEMKKQMYLKNETTIRKLKPGEYELRIYALDEYKRKSVGEDQRTLLVPSLSDVKAPKLLKMSIKK